MGTILRNYQPKPSHMDPVRSNFHDFPPDLAVSNLHSLHICYIESIYLLYENQIVSSVEKLELLLQGRVGPLGPWPERPFGPVDQQALWAPRALWTLAPGGPLGP